MLRGTRDARAGLWHIPSLILGLCVLAGCEAPQTPQTSASGMSSSNRAVAETPEAKIADVTAALRALGPSVDPSEAARVAEIAVRKPLIWAKDWNVIDPPLVHNFKVVNGLREKGVCQDWANALELELRRAGLRSLQIHRALGNVRKITLEHATVVVTVRGQPMETGLILDPWRIGQGRLWFARVAEDARYDWETTASARAWRLANAKRARDGAS